MLSAISRSWLIDIRKWHKWSELFSQKWGQFYQNPKPFSHYFCIIELFLCSNQDLLNTIIPKIRALDETKLFGKEIWHEVCEKKLVVRSRSWERMLDFCHGMVDRRPFISHFMWFDNYIPKNFSLQNEKQQHIQRERSDKTKKIMQSLQVQESDYKKRKMKKF
jgi:hypothetical protein